MGMKRLTVLAAAFALLLAACAGVENSPGASVALPTQTTLGQVDGTTTTSPPPTEVPDTSQPDRTASTLPEQVPPPDRTASTLPEQVPPEENPLPDGPVDTSAVPAGLMTSILADAATRTGMSAFDIFAVRAEQALWNDGSLGCPQPDMSYTQAQVDGYWVVLKAGDTLLDYRASQSGFFTFCDTAFPGSGGAPTG